MAEKEMNKDDIVHTLCQNGQALSDIATLVGLSGEDDLKKKYGKLLEKWRLEGAAKRREQLHNLAVRGNLAALLHLDGEGESGLVGTSTLCEWLGVSRQTISNAKERGAITPVARGKYRLKESIRGYVRHQIEVAAGREGGGKKGASLVDQRCRLDAARAKAQEMKNAQMMGGLVPKDEINAAVIDAFGRVRSGLGKLPPKLAAQAPEGMKKIARSIAEQVVDDALRELSLERRDEEDDDAA